MERGDTLLIATAKSAHRLQEIGALVGGLGMLVIVIGMATALAAESRAGGPTGSGRRRDRLVHLTGSLITGLGFLILLLGLRAK